jgi:hypothetical protein
MDDLDTVLGALHQEKLVVLRGQLSGIAVEIGERERIAHHIGLSLDAELLTVGSTILNLTRPESPDLYLKERVALEDQRRSLRKELRDEQRSAWQDVQELRREHRQIEQEVVQAGQRRTRLEELAHAPGSV